MKTLVMIPTYNERQNIVRLVQSILALGGEIGVVVVDDDSPDGTAEALGELARRLPQLHVICRRGERGRGTAGVRGMRYALEQGAEYIVEMDGDFSHHPRHLPDLLREVKGWDVVIGSRAVAGGHEVGRRWPRRLMTRMANRYIRWLLKVPVQDATSGYRCFHRRVLEAIHLELMTSTGPAIVEEILYACRLLGFRIKEIPITFEDRRQGRSNLTLRKVLATAATILRLRFALPRRYGRMAAEGIIGSPPPGGGQQAERPGQP